MTTTTDTPDVAASAPAAPPEISAADLAGHIARADAQTSDLEAQVAAAKAAHRSASHAAIVSGQPAPPPAKRLAELVDHLEGLKGARADLAEQHRKRVLAEATAAGESASAKAAELHEEFTRKYQLALALCQASFLAFAKVAGVLPEEHIVRRDLAFRPEDSDRVKVAAQLVGLRSRLPVSHQGYVDGAVAIPGNPWNRTLATIAKNHINELMG